MRCNVLLLAALAAAARVRAASPAASQANDVDEEPAYWDFFEDGEIDGDPPTSHSNGFALVSNATGPGCDGTSMLRNEVHGLLFQGYHTGPTTAAGVLFELSLKHQGKIFYLNGTSGGNMSVLTDSGQPQVPYGLVMPDQAGSRAAFGDEEDDQGAIYAPFEDPDHDAVSFRAGPGTPALMGSLHEGVINLQGSGTFLACNRSVPYSPNGWAFTVHYLYTHGDGSQVPSRCNNGVTPPGAPPGIPDNCVPITLFAVCTKLPAAVVGGYANHAYTHPVECMTLLEDDEYYEADEADWLEESGGEAEAGAEEQESEPEQPGQSEQPGQPEHTDQPEHPEQPEDTEQPEHPSEKTEL